MSYIKYYLGAAPWLFFMVIMVFLVGHHRTASITLWEAGQHWLQGQSLYGLDGRGFIYLPQSAILYAPFSALSFSWSEALWRILSLGIFAAGLFRFIAVFFAEHTSQTVKYFFVATGISFLLAFDSARNGQIHLLITGLMMFAAVKISQQQWSKVAFLLVLAFFLKPTAIVFLLLTFALFYFETWRYFLIWAMTFLLIPFLTQSWHYVLVQYQQCFQMLMVAANTGSAQEWSQIFNLISQTGWVMPAFLQNTFRIIAAVIILVWAKQIKQREDLKLTAVWLLMLAMNYLMLFNPRTENNDYMMLIPGLSYCMISSLLNKEFYRTAFLMLIVLGLAGSYYISNLFAGHYNWGAPLMGVLAIAYLGFWFFRISLLSFNERSPARLEPRRYSL